MTGLVYTGVNNVHLRSFYNFNFTRKIFLPGPKLESWSLGLRANQCNNRQNRTQVKGSRKWLTALSNRIGDVALLMVIV